MNDEAPRRPNRNFPLVYCGSASSRFGPTQWKLMSVAERNAQIAEEKRLAAEKLAAANAADAAAATSPEQPPPAPAEPPILSGPETPPDFSRHPRRCAICSHPDRDAIEGDFIRWRSPDQIARDYNLPDRASGYRHAHYAGLFQRRKRQVARVLESLLESADSCPIEAADMIIRAARLYVRLNEHGEWVEAPRTQYLITGAVDSTQPSAQRSDPTPPPVRSSDPAPPSAKRRRAAAKSDRATPKPDRCRRSQKTLTATHSDSEIPQTHENK
jgi:hypothetical protein